MPAIESTTAAGALDIGDPFDLHDHVAVDGPRLLALDGVALAHVVLEAADHLLDLAAERGNQLAMAAGTAGTSVQSALAQRVEGEHDRRPHLPGLLLDRLVGEQLEVAAVLA